MEAGAPVSESQKVMYLLPGLAWQTAMQPSASSACPRCAIQIFPRLVLSVTLADMATPLEDCFTSWPSEISAVGRHAFPSCQSLYTGFFSLEGSHGFSYVTALSAQPTFPVSQQQGHTSGQRTPQSHHLRNSRKACPSPGPDYGRK
eukprot:CAMPEP_0204417140 /NCGR_PEP_ID=MMETSP0470-20130426/26893_2 /ASSEMBLY_ACC=CAM_ASM_000385 /TAXON_ID=2969 /ORGANISM="Oxyrrhis marina" /LENGTH=145 /DNA_ID=CAMNT_0051413713 /DNA_START=172 /DNA_END=610 /DNA_ORIENTATION=-